MAPMEKVHVILLLQLVVGVTSSYAFGLKSTASHLFGVNLKPDYPLTIVQTSGGKLGIWDGRGSNLAGIKLSLGGNSVMLPAHFDCDILAYVVEGSAKWGLVYASGQWVESVPLEKGDSFVIPKETIVWFYNDDMSDVTQEFTFVGFADTTNALKPGVITALPIIGPKSMYHGFNEKNLGDAWALEKGTAKRLIHQQNEVMFLKLSEKIYLSNPEAEKVSASYIFKTITSEPDIYIPGGGKQWAVVASKRPELGLLNSMGLGGELIIQRPNSLYGPAYSSNSNTLIYVIKGSGHIWLVEPLRNIEVLDISFFENQVVSIPKGYGFLIVAGDDEDLQHFQVADNSDPSKIFFAGKRSPYLAIPWEILRVSFDVDDVMLDKVLHSRTWEYTLLPPYKPVDRAILQSAASS